MSYNQERKKHVNLTPELFEMMRSHYKIEKIGKLCSLTGLSRSRIYDLIDKIREIGLRITFNDVKKQRGRIKIDKSKLLTDIRLEMGRDNSLTQVALKNIFKEKDMFLCHCKLLNILVGCDMHNFLLLPPTLQN